MQVERHPFWFNVSSHFPNACAFRHCDTCRYYKAERDGKPFLIVDDGTMADFLDDSNPRDRELLNQLVSVIEFDNEVEREAYIARELPPVPPATDLTPCSSKIRD